MGKGTFYLRWTYYPLWRRNIFWEDGTIHLGDNVSMGQNTVMYASKNGEIFIGKDIQIAAMCYLIDMDHGTAAEIPIVDQTNRVEKVVIGQDVWIATYVTILKASHIENGAVVGANALVKGEIPSNGVATGFQHKHIDFANKINHLPFSI